MIEVYKCVVFQFTGTAVGDCAERLLQEELVKTQKTGRVYSPDRPVRDDQRFL
jgi:hypothetical protein